MGIKSREPFIFILVMNKDYLICSRINLQRGTEELFREILERIEIEVAKQDGIILIQQQILYIRRPKKDDEVNENLNQLIILVEKCLTN